MQQASDSGFHPRYLQLDIQEGSIGKLRKDVLKKRDFSALGAGPIVQVLLAEFLVIVCRYVTAANAFIVDTYKPLVRSLAYVKLKTIAT